MNIKKQLSFFIAFFIIPNLLFSQQDNNIVTKDPEATKILNQLSQKIKSYISFKLDFTFQLEAYNGKIKITDQKKGTVWMKKDKYKATIDKQEIFCDGKTVWNYDPNTNEVQITQPDPNNKTITPQKLLGNFYENDFLYKLNPPVRLGKELFQEIEFVPIDKNKSFFKVLLYIQNVKDFGYHIDRIKVFEKNGNKYTYLLSKLVVDKKMTESFFEFNKEKYPKVEVIDLR